MIGASGCNSSIHPSAPIVRNSGWLAGLHGATASKARSAAWTVSTSASPHVLAGCLKAAAAARACSSLQCSPCCKVAHTNWETTTSSTRSAARTVASENS